MAWRIDVSASAKKHLSKLSRTDAKRITAFLRERLAMSDNPRSTGHGLTGPLSGLWRYRVGDYRIICDIQDHKLVVLVVEIGHRSEVYRP